VKIPRRARPDSARAEPPAPPEAPAPAPHSAGTLPLSSPLDQEAMARWIEALYSTWPAQLQREVAWLASHPNDPDTKGRILWLKHSLSSGRYIAYTIRTAKLQKGG
jgi:hypothetical protein